MKLFSSEFSSPLLLRALSILLLFLDEACSEEGRNGSSAFRCDSTSLLKKSLKSEPCEAPLGSLDFFRSLLSKEIQFRCSSLVTKKSVTKTLASFKAKLGD